ncbi:hypothetical protein SHIRM173S_08720 [Streptomyces hirsutus]
MVPEDVVAWREVLNTDAARYGGGDVTNPDPVKPKDGGLRITLPPLATVWLVPHDLETGGLPSPAPYPRPDGNRRGCGACRRDAGTQGVGGKAGEGYGRSHGQARAVGAA